MAHLNNADQAEKFLTDVHSKALVDLSASEYQFSEAQSMKRAEQAKPADKKLEGNNRARWGTAFLASVAMFTPLSLFGSENSAAISNPHPAPDGNLSNAVRVYDFTAESWELLKAHLDENRPLESIPDLKQHWNNIDAALHVSDVTALESIHRIREEIIEAGGHDARIPEEVVHSALYTSAKYAESIQTHIAL
ncbi:MAG: hypothetical protein KDD62_05625, partial [Bdellovibrionales bacterium]|nr:hypothetical protein [Bdellovibrionales bacterium]